MAYSADESVQTAHHHFRAGRFAEAESLYRQVLAQQPDQPEALRGLGMLAAHVGKFSDAYHLIQRALVLRPNWAEAHEDLGNVLHSMGQPLDAITAFRQAIRINPKLATTHCDLGNALGQVQKYDEAIDSYRHAIALRPDFPSAYCNMGLAMRKLKNLEQAIELFQKAISLQPLYPEAYNNLANSLMDVGRRDEAIVAYRRAIVLQPDFTIAHYNLGVALEAAHQAEQAVEAYRVALRFQPGFADALCSLGNALMKCGQFEEALAAYHRAIEIDPTNARPYDNMSVALRDMGRPSQAIESAHRAVQMKPDFFEAHNNLGVALRDSGDLNQAIAAYRASIALNPKYAESYNNLGIALCEAKQLDEGVVVLQRAVELSPASSEPHSNLGRALAACGRVDKAIESFRRALQIDSHNYTAHSNLIFTLHYHPAFDGKMIHEELVRWNRQHAEPQAKFIRPHGNIPDPSRPLRIGYISADFREHVVGQNLLPFFREHDHHQFEIFCYSDVLRTDTITDQLRSYTDSWQKTKGWPNAKVAEQIRNDQIDILVELALHTADNRLVMMAQKPAPVQVSYLGYPGSTGLSVIDYRFSDPHLDPTDDDAAFYSEQTIRLPETYWCYGVPASVPEPSPRPAIANGFITFGCLNNFAKVSIDAQNLWAELMRELPSSRLLLHCRAGAHVNVVRERFVAAGINPNRLEFIPEQPWDQYVQTHSRFDIALDPFPWGGGITTCNALWMGVPVVTLSGQTAVGRGGASILANINLSELVAHAPDQYRQIARDLAGNLPRLAKLSASLRSRMRLSPLMDAPRFARNVEAAYRSIWRRWCETSSSI